MNTASVSICDVSLEQSSSHQELSATVDGERIWYRFPAELELISRPEAFLAPALFEAMVRGAPVVCDMPVSAELLQSLPKVQKILNCWNKDLQVVPVYANSTDSYPSTDMVACCFSGGVDSSFTYSKHRNSITHLLLVQGFTSGRGGPDDWQENVDARRRFAQAEKKSLIHASTNVVDFMKARELSILLTHGSLLGGLGASLGLKQLLIPASYTFNDLMPWGSHPMLDPLWGTETMEVVHHGAEASRVDKTREVAKHRYLLDQLQVCWFAGGRNCGACGKCVRTALALYLMGASAGSLKPFGELRQLRLLKRLDEQNYPYVKELSTMAQEANELIIARRLNRYLHTYRFRKAAAEFARELVGIRGRNLVRQLKPQAWHSTRGSLRSIRTDARR